MMDAAEAGHRMGTYADRLEIEDRMLDDEAEAVQLSAAQGEALRGVLFYGFAAICATLRGDLGKPPESVFATKPAPEYNVGSRLRLTGFEKRRHNGLYEISYITGLLESGHVSLELRRVVEGD